MKDSLVTLGAIASILMLAMTVYAIIVMYPRYQQLQTAETSPVGKLLTGLIGGGA